MKINKNHLVEFGFKEKVKELTSLEIGLIVINKVDIERKTYWVKEIKPYLLLAIIIKNDEFIPVLNKLERLDNRIFESEIELRKIKTKEQLKRLWSNLTEKPIL